MGAASLPAPRPELVLDAHARLGEGPLWDASRGVLWWIDILAGEIHAFDPRSGTDRTRAAEGQVGATALADDGRVVLALPDRLAALDPEAGRIATLADLPPGRVPLRCNDGRCDPDGGLWLGRMALDEAPGEGSLVRVLPGGGTATVLDGLGCPNGMAWAADGRSFAFIDSPRRAIERFAWDPDAGVVGPPATLFSLDVADLPADAMPDGTAIDAEDHLWVAVWGGGCLLRIAPDGRLIARVDLPVSRPTSCAFGGPDLTDLYVTSAREGLGPAARTREPHAGGLFRLSPGVAGRPETIFRGLVRTRA